MRGLCVLGCCLLIGCVLGGRPEPPRYFQPDLSRDSAAEDGSDTLARGRSLRFNRVKSATYLSERMVWHTSDGEFGFYDSRRWTEHPSHYVEQQVARELFELRGLRRARAGRVPTLDIEVLSFDELIGPAHEARVEVRVLLLDKRSVSILERSYVATKPISEDDPISTTRAMGAALLELVRSLSGDVRAALSRARR